MFKKIILSILSIIIVMVLAIFVIQSWRARILNQTQVTKSDTPTIFLHGSGGTYLSLGPMTFRLAHHHLGQRAMTIWVSKTGQLNIHQYRPLKNNPLILVILKNNHDPIGGLSALNKIMAILQNKYHVPKVNFVGHSMGGGIMTQYLLQRQKSGPRVIKFVSIATPYQGFGKAKGPKNPRYQAMLREKNNLPRNIAVLNIIGNVSHKNGDTEVSIPSAKGLRQVVIPASYHLQVFPGNWWTVSHFMIHENPKVDRLIANFLWH